MAYIQLNSPVFGNPYLHAPPPSSIVEDEAFLVNDEPQAPSTVEMDLSHNQPKESTQDQPKEQENEVVDLESVICIQLYCHTLFASKRLLLIRKSAITIQKYYRGYRARILLKELKKAPLQPQSQPQREEQAKPLSQQQPQPTPDPQPLPQASDKPGPKEFPVQRLAKEKERPKSMGPSVDLWASANANTDSPKLNIITRTKGIEGRRRPSRGVRPVSREISSPSLLIHMRDEQPESGTQSLQEEERGTGTHQPRLINLGNGLMLPKFDPSKVILRSTTGLRDRPVSISNPEMMYLNSKMRTSNNVGAADKLPTSSETVDTNKEEELMSSKLKKLTEHRHSMMPTMMPPAAKEKGASSLSTATIALKESSDKTGGESPDRGTLACIQEDENENESTSSQSTSVDQTQSTSSSSKVDSGDKTSKDENSFPQIQLSKRTRATVYRSGSHRLSSANLSLADMNEHQPTTQQEDNIDNTLDDSNANENKKTLHMSLNTEKKNSRIRKFLRLFLRRRPSQKDMEKTGILSPETSTSESRKSKKIASK